jgi:hypothetical protein
LFFAACDPLPLGLIVGLFFNYGAKVQLLFDIRKFFRVFFAFFVYFVYFSNKIALGMCIFCTDQQKAEGFPNSSAPINLKSNNYEKQKVFTFTLTGFLSAWEVISRPCLNILLLTAHWSASEQVILHLSLFAYTLRRKRNVRSYRVKH